MVRYRPYVILNAAMTLDGKIATSNGDSNISSSRDLARVHALRGEVDAILVGINTVLADDPILTARNGRKNPTRVIVDSKGRIGSTTRIMRSCNVVPAIIAVSERASRSKLKKIKSHGATVLLCGKNKVDLKKLLAMLKKRGIKRLLVEGGGEINWSVLKDGLVDEISVTIAPRVVGGRHAITLVEGEGVARISDGVKLKLGKISRMGNEVVLFYRAIN